MKKTNKKLDQQICKALTIACENIKAEVNGFVWLTHFVDYKQFPDSLSIVCIFDTNTDLLNAGDETKDRHISGLIYSELEKIQISLKRDSNTIYYDTEQTCSAENNGNWQQRFSKPHYLNTINSNPRIISPNKATGTH